MYLGPSHQIRPQPQLLWVAACLMTSWVALEDQAQPNQYIKPNLLPNSHSSPISMMIQTWASGFQWSVIRLTRLLTSSVPSLWTKLLQLFRAWTYKWPFRNTWSFRCSPHPQLSLRPFQLIRWHKTWRYRTPWMDRSHSHSRSEFFIITCRQGSRWARPESSMLSVSDNNAYRRCLRYSHFNFST